MRPVAHVDVAAVDDCGALSHPRLRESQLLPRPFEFASQIDALLLHLQHRARRIHVTDIGLNIEFRSTRTAVLTKDIAEKASHRRKKLLLNSRSPKAMFCGQQRSHRLSGRPVWNVCRVAIATKPGF